MGGKRRYELVDYKLPAPPPKIEPVPERELLAEVDALVEAEQRLLYLAEARAYRDALWDTIRRMKAPQAHHKTPLPRWLKLEAH